MPLPQNYTKGVLFVGRKPVGGEKKITATGFLVVVETPRMEHVYVVTAGHTVEGSDTTFVRIRMADGTFRDEPVPEWIPNGKHDIAVAPIDLPDGCDVIASPLDHFIDAPDALDGYGEIELGDALYFIGLLGKVKAMTERNVPLVRAGFLGALWQEEVPVRRPGERVKLITAHLIDCRSFSGFSGSPCYLQKSRARVGQMPNGQPSVYTEYRTLLFGVIAGHFDDWVKTRSRDVSPEGEAEDEMSEDAYFVNDEIKAPVSTGVGYVIPAEFIRQTLMKEELEESRVAKELHAEAEAVREDEENAATPDSIDPDAGEFGRFEELTRRLVNTPKPEKEGDAG